MLIYKSMMKVISNILKKIAYILIGIVVFFILYLGCIYMGKWIPTEEAEIAENLKTVEIFVESNGVHTDIVLPTDTSCWVDKQIVLKQNSRKSLPAYIAYGWGDKGFYLDTPTWADLKFSTAFKAVTGLSSAAMHITLVHQKPKIDSEFVFKIMISPEQLHKLRNYVAKDFVKSDSGFKYINCCWYYQDKRDGFYDAEGSYSLFKTCNVWTNQGLKHAGIKTAIWAPLSSGVTYHLR